LTDHRNVSAGLEGFHESFGAGFGDSTEIVDEVGFGHTDTGVTDGEGFVFGVGDDFDLEFFLGFED